MIERISTWLRWILLVPVSLGAGFVVAGLIALLPGGAGASSGAFAYAAAFFSGLVYVWAAVYTAHTVAPSRKRIVATVLGLLILGDLIFVLFLLPTDFFAPAEVAPRGEGGLGVLLGLLRAEDFSGLPNGGVVKIAGVLAGLGLAWRMRLRRVS